MPLYTFFEFFNDLFYGRDVTAHAGVKIDRLASIHGKANVIDHLSGAEFTDKEGAYPGIPGKGVDLRMGEGEQCNRPQ